MRVSLTAVSLIALTYWLGLSGCKIKRPANSGANPTTESSAVAAAATDVAQGRRVVVERVIDGDTLDLADGIRVRLAGIDAPESKHPRKAVECLAFEASRFLKKLVEHREVVLFVDSQGRDKFGRILAHIEVDSRYANGELVGHGFAVVYRARRSDRDERLKALEAGAKAQAIGLWGPHCQDTL